MDFEHLHPPPERRQGTQSDATDWLNPLFNFPAQGFSLEEAINRLIRIALKQTENNVSAAARLLGVSRDYVRYRLAEAKSSEAQDSPGPGSESPG